MEFKDLPVHVRQTKVLEALRDGPASNARLREILGTADKKTLNNTLQALRRDGKIVTQVEDGISVYVLEHAEKGREIRPRPRYKPVITPVTKEPVAEPAGCPDPPPSVEPPQGDQVAAAEPPYQYQSTNPMDAFTDLVGPGFAEELGREWIEEAHERLEEQVAPTDPVEPTPPQDAPSQERQPEALFPEAPVDADQMAITSDGSLILLLEDGGRAHLGVRTVLAIRRWANSNSRLLEDIWAHQIEEETTNG